MVGEAPALTQPEIRLATGLEALGLETDQAQRACLIAFVRLLQRWNKVYNLTAIHDASRIVSHHILDSLVLVPYLRGPSVLDVGSGAGLPGLPLAILLPQMRFTLVDSVGKKTAFMHQAVMELALTNVSIVNSRVEHLAGTWDEVICRAFASLPDIVALTRERVGAGGRILALKGELSAQEMVPGAQVTRLRVPYVDTVRQLVSIDVKGLAGGAP